jgi:aldose sugar dehydrogenase
MSSRGWRRSFTSTTSFMLVASLLLGAGFTRAAEARLQSTRQGRTPAISAVPVISGIDWPAAFTIDRDGRIFYGNRLTGEIRIYDPASALDTLFYTVPGLMSEVERGLLGIALHPRYPTAPLVYVYATRDVNGQPRNQIIRIRDGAGVGQSPRVIWTENIVAAENHQGGRILFGPRGRLFAVVGDATNPANSQDPKVDAGRMLRMTTSGSAPPDNPVPGSLMWAYGIRNSFGFTFDPLTDDLWETENGPICNDELNRIDPGANYGWGLHWSCETPPLPPENTNQDGPNPVLPEWYFDSTIAPVGAAFCVGCGIASAEGAFFFGAWNDFTIRQVTLSADRLHITAVTDAYTHSHLLLSLERAPDGTVYFSDLEGIWKLVEVEGEG